MSKIYRTAPLRIEPSPPILVKCPCPGCFIPYINNSPHAWDGDGPHRLPCTGPDGKRKARKETWTTGLVLNAVMFFLMFMVGLLGNPERVATVSYWAVLFGMWLVFLIFYVVVTSLAIKIREEEDIGRSWS